VSGHSPGPWTIHGGVGPGGEGVQHVFAGNDTQVAIVWGREDDEPKANAALIARAPDLLKALREIEASAVRTVGEFPRDSADMHDGLTEIRDIAREALKDLP
jgi:hypothetical protein